MNLLDYLRKKKEEPSKVIATILNRDNPVITEEFPEEIAKNEVIPVVEEKTSSETPLPVIYEEPSDNKRRLLFAKLYQMSVLLLW